MAKLHHENIEEEDVVADWRKSCNKKFRNKNDDIEITFEGGFDKKKSAKIEEEVPSLNKQKKTMK